MDAYIPPSDTRSLSAFYSCVKGASEYYRVPVMALLAIYGQEQGGRLAPSKNPNGTRDHGRFRVNDGSWGRYLAEHNIGLEKVGNDGCLNAYVGAHIFKNRYVRCAHDVWCAIGLYHSENEPQRSTYVANVYGKYQTIVQDKAFLNWFRSLPLYDAGRGKWEYVKEGRHHATTGKL